MGMTSFESDAACTAPAAAMRILLMPSFHPEICITFAEGQVSVVSARAMVWHQFKPKPMLTDRAQGSISAEVFSKLLASMVPITNPDAVFGMMIDGMTTELLQFQSGIPVIRAGRDGPNKGNFSAFVRLAITSAWECISNPYCRNALAEAACYLGMKLPREQEPERKPTIEMMVLGPEEIRTQLLDALLRNHKF